MRARRPRRRRTTFLQPRGEVRTRSKEGTVSATVLYMSMSLDGLIAGPNERPDNGLGDGGHRLHDWFPAAGVNAQVIDEFMATGAVVAGAAPLRQSRSRAHRAR